MLTGWVDLDPTHWATWLRRRGHREVAVIGHGVEGVVFRLGGGLVAKVWRTRTVDELTRLQRMYVDLDAAAPNIATPFVEAVVDTGGPVVTIERELLGQPLQDRLDHGATELPDSAVDAVVASLDALRAVPATDAMRALPVVGETRPFRTARSGTGRPPSRDTFPGALADLVERRSDAVGHHLEIALPDFRSVCTALVHRLRGIPPVPDTVVHGDLFGANILVDAAGHPSAVLDFGFMTTAGDPRFDAAVTAGVMNMYGAHAGEITRRLTDQLADRLGYQRELLVLYRAAYAVVTATLFGTDTSDGHFRWCVGQLADPATADALGG